MDRIRNTSDAASRRLSAKTFPGSDWWKRGTGFLWQDKSSWPLPPVRQEEMSDDDLEMKRVKGEARAHIVELNGSIETIQKLFCFFSLKSLWHTCCISSLGW